MQNRANILQKLLGDISFPHKEVVSNLDRDYKAIYKMLERRGINKNIGMSKDKDKSTIWFRKRK